MKIILGDICYPKSKVLIIPSNSMGIMNRGIAKKVLKHAWIGVENQSKEEAKKKKYKLGECFFTGPGRLRRRGVVNICHAIIKRLPSDLISVSIVQEALNNSFLKVIKNKLSSVTIPGFAIDSDNIDEGVIANITAMVCNRYKRKVEIKIIDDNKEFIEKISKILNIDYEVKKQRIS